MGVYVSAPTFANIYANLKQKYGVKVPCIFFIVDKNGFIAKKYYEMILRKCLHTKNSIKAF